MACASDEEIPTQEIQPGCLQFVRLYEWCRGPSSSTRTWAQQPVTCEQDSLPCGKDLPKTDDVTQEAGGCH